MKWCLKNPQNKVNRSRDGLYKLCGCRFIWCLVQHDSHSICNSFCLNLFCSFPELELRQELCILNKQCCTSEIYPRTTVFVMRDFSRNEYWGFCLFACFLNVISESDNCETAPWYENISFYNLGVGQYLSVFLMQSQDWRLLLQTYLQDLPSS